MDRRGRLTPTVSRRIDEFFATPAPAGTRRGVMLGISGGLCAFAGDPADGDVRVLPIAAVGQGFHELYPYLDQVIAGRPAFILIQGTALVTTGNAAIALPGGPAPAQAAAAGAAAAGRRREGRRRGGRGHQGHVPCPRAGPRRRGPARLDEDIGWVTLERGEQARQRLLSETGSAP